MIASFLTRTGALLLGVTGHALLFAADVLLPRIVPGVPPSAAWFGQLLGAALIALAWLNWLHRDALLGGIYGRPVVLANAMFYMLSAVSVLRGAVQLRRAAGAGKDAPGAEVLWVAGVVLGLLAGAYWWILYRGPLERDRTAYRAAQG